MQTKKSEKKEKIKKETKIILEEKREKSLQRRKFKINFAIFYYIILSYRVSEYIFEEKKWIFVDEKPKFLQKKVEILKKTLISKNKSKKNKKIKKMLKKMLTYKMSYDKIIKLFERTAKYLKNLTERRFKSRTEQVKLLRTTLSKKQTSVQKKNTSAKVNV
ncbi:MAG: hypothetical protein RR993_03035 [Clostridia bacterium]